MRKEQINVVIGILAVDGTINLSLGRLLYDLPFMTADDSNTYAFVPWIEGGVRPQEYARNLIIKKAFDHKFDVLVMIDDDMIYHGPKTIIDLLNTPDADIAGPLQLMFRPDTPNGPSIFPVAMNLDKSQPEGKQAHVIMPVAGAKYTTVDSVGSGIIMIKRKVLTNPGMLLAAGMDPPAYFRNVYEANGHRLRGLDVDFCARAGECGFKVVVNWASTCGHFKRIDLYELETYAKRQWLDGFQLGSKQKKEVPPDGKKESSSDNGDRGVDEVQVRPKEGEEGSDRGTGGDQELAQVGVDQDLLTGAGSTSRAGRRREARRQRKLHVEVAR